MRKENIKKVILILAAAAVFGTAAGGTVVAGNAIADRYLAAETAENTETDSGEMQDTAIIAAEPVEEYKIPGILLDEPEEEVTEEPADADTAEEADAEAEADTDETIPVTSGQAQTLSVADVAETAMPSMVAITSTTVARTQWFFGGQRQPQEAISAGSGIIIGMNNSDIMIATNAHVIDSATALSVTFADNTTVEGSLVGEDSENDLAVVSVPIKALSEETLSSIRVIAIGDSDEVKIGEQVVAIGNALGYGQSVSAGYLSAKDRGTQDSAVGLLQTDAAINPGNSGGALLNMNGELIGINSAKYADTAVEGMGFAIPISYARPILEMMMSGAESADTPENTITLGGDAAYLGIQCYSVPEEAATYYATPVGVLIKSVIPGSPAEQAGLQSADIITALGGQEVETQEELTALLRNYVPGDRAMLTYARADADGAYREAVTEVVFGARDAA